MLIDGTKVKELRRNAGKTTAELAVAADMSAPWVVKLEFSTRHKVNTHVAHAIARTLKCKLEDITP
jgi:DNA-binding XRE family transcriptional regulator